MINKVKKMALIMFTSLSFFALAPTGVAQAAWNPFEGACKSGGQSSTVCKDSNNNGSNPLTGSEGVIMDVVDILAFIAGAAATIILILAGLRMVTSGGSTDDVANARRTIIYTAVGLIILVFARTVVSFILGKL